MQEEYLDIICSIGNAELLKYLVEKYNFKIKDRHLTLVCGPLPFNRDLHKAQTAKYLFQFILPNIENLVTANKYGNLELVKLILESKIDPNFNNNQLLKDAYQKRFLDVVEYLKKFCPG